MDPKDVATVTGTDQAQSASPDVTAPLARGAQIGRLVVLDALGRGGMGVVYRAYDPQLDRKVAVKLLRPDASHDNEERLVREGQAMAQLAHPNILTVYDVGTVGDQVFIAMELIEGSSLRQWMRQPRGWREVLDVFAQAGRGLAAAHAAKLIHRDFKPDNVLLGGDGRARVADFGLARSLSEPAAGAQAVDAPVALVTTGVQRGVDLTTPLTLTGTMLGTPAYMAPEQLVGAATDERTDQFCFCVAFYEALYGHRPFVASTLAEQTLAVTQGRIRPEPKDSAVPAWLRQVVLRGLETRAEDRFPSMAALLKALPADPEADSRTSSPARAVLTAIFAVLIGGAMAYLRFFTRAAVDPSALGAGAFALMALASLAVAVPLLVLWRRTLLGTRVSRQIVASLLVIYYTSLLASYVGHRLSVPAGASMTISELWGGGCLLLLGITLERLFLLIGALAVLAGLIALARPADAVTINQLALFALMLAIAIAWGRRRK